MYRTPTLIRRIEDRDGRVVYEAHPFARRVMSEGSAFILTSMLQSVVQQGTAKALSDLPMEVAAKTGTVGDETGNRDIWLAAYTAEHAAVIWMGFDENSHGKLLPPDSGGGGYPAALMKEVLTGLYADRTAPVFHQPESVVRVRLDGYTMDAQHEAFACACFPFRYSRIFCARTKRPIPESRRAQMFLSKQAVGRRITSSQARAPAAFNSPWRKPRASTVRAPSVSRPTQRVAERRL